MFRIFGKRSIQPITSQACWLRTKLPRDTISALTGIPEDELSRPVIIHKPSAAATQSGSAKYNVWKIDYVSTSRWKNPLMGWSSSNDTTAQLQRLDFHSKEEAIAYCETMGLQYEVQKETSKENKEKSYSDNFKFKGTRTSPIPDDLL